MTYELDSDRLVREGDETWIRASKAGGSWRVEGNFSKEDIHDLIVKLLEIAGEGK